MSSLKFNRLTTAFPIILKHLSLQKVFHAILKMHFGDLILRDVEQLFIEAVQFQWDVIATDVTNSDNHDLGGTYHVIASPRPYVIYMHYINRILSLIERDNVKQSDKVWLNVMQFTIIHNVVKKMYMQININ